MMHRRSASFDRNEQSRYDEGYRGNRRPGTPTRQHSDDWNGDHDQQRGYQQRHAWSPVESGSSPRGGSSSQQQQRGSAMLDDVVARLDRVERDSRALYGRVERAERENQMLKDELYELRASIANSDSTSQRYPHISTGPCSDGAVPLLHAHVSAPAGPTASTIFGGGSFHPQSGAYIPKPDLNMRYCVLCGCEYQANIEAAHVGGRRHQNAVAKLEADRRAHATMAALGNSASGTPQQQLQYSLRSAPQQPQRCNPSFGIPPSFDSQSSPDAAERPNCSPYAQGPWPPPSIGNEATWAAHRTALLAVDGPFAAFDSGPNPAGNSTLVPPPSVVFGTASSGGTSGGNAVASPAQNTSPLTSTSRVIRTVLL
jgi:hypothetical protein